MDPTSRLWKNAEGVSHSLLGARERSRCFVRTAGQRQIKGRL
jgi:hypothetical protein